MLNTATQSEWKDALRHFEQWRARGRSSEETQEGERLLSQFVQFAIPRGLTLDVGCGPGSFGRTVGFRDYVGIDPLAARATGFPLIRGVAERLPVRSSSFDTLITLGAMDHFASVEDALREFHRVLVPGGRLYIIQHVTRTDPKFKVLQTLRYLRSRSFRKLAESAVSNVRVSLRIHGEGLEEAYGHVSDFTERGLLEVVRSLFRIERTHYDQQQMFVSALRR